MAALDVCIASPDGGGAGADACVSAAARKTERYSEVMEELEAAGIEYKPLVWTCWGRPSPDAQAALRTLSSVAARRCGISDPRGLEQRARALISAALWRRAAAMAIACLRRADVGEAQEVLPGFESDESGESDDGGFDGGCGAVA